MIVTGQAPTPRYRSLWTSLLNDANGALHAQPPRTCLATSLSPQFFSAGGHHR